MQKLPVIVLFLGTDGAMFEFFLLREKSIEDLCRNMLALEVAYCKYMQLCFDRSCCDEDRL